MTSHVHDNPAHRRRCPRRLAACLAGLCLVLPGCLTRHMWSTYSPEWTTETYVRKDVDTCRRGALFAAAPAAAGHAASLLWVHETSANGTSRAMRLAPAGTAACCAPELLDASGFDVFDARLHRDEQIRDGHRERHTAELRMTLRIRPTHATDAPPPARLPPACRQALQHAARDGGAPESLLLSRLRVLMPRAAGFDASWQVRSLVVTDTQLTPVADHAFDSDRLRVADHSFEFRQLDVDALADQLVVAMLGADARTRIVTMPATTCFLLAHCRPVDAERGVCSHTSQWSVQPLREPVIDPIATGRRWHSLVPVVETARATSRTTYTLPRLDLGMVGRLVATPLTLAADLTLGPGTLRLWQAITDTLPPERRDPIEPDRRTR